MTVGVTDRFRNIHFQPNRDYQWGFTLIPVNHANGVESKLGYSYK